MLNHHRRCWPTSIQYLPVNHAAACLYDVHRTHDVGLRTRFRFNFGPASQPIPGSMTVNRLRRWPNTTPTSAQRIILLDSTAALLCGDAFLPMSPERPLPKNSIHWPNADVNRYLNATLATVGI